MFLRGVRILCCLATLALPGFSEVIIDFAGGGGGSASYNAGTGALTITTPIISAEGIGTPANNLVTEPVQSGSLNINATGGTFNSTTGTYTWTGGTFSIVGGISAIGIPTGTTLLNGTIASATVSTSGLFATLVAANGSDTKNATLVNFYCPTCNTTAWGFGPATTTLANPTPGFFTGGSFTAGTFSTDVKNTYVPEPGSIVLLGTIAIGALVKFRRAKQQA